LSPAKATLLRIGKMTGIILPPAAPGVNFDPEKSSGEAAGDGGAKGLAVPVPLFLFSISH
jgi:hypothetical protein